MRLYLISAIALLAASSFVFLFLDDDAGPILIIAGVLFWASGAALVALLTFALGKRLGVSWGRRNGPAPDEQD